MMRLASVCSGIGGAELAFAGLATHAFASEIEPFPRAVLRHHYPDLTIHGDFTEISATSGPVDVLVGGTPCQSFSVAGLRGGMADARGNLALEYLRLAERLRAKWLLWENVPGVLSSNEGRDFGAFLGGLAALGYWWAYRILDAQYFGLAQRRRRVFVVGCLDDWRRAAAVLFEPASLRGDSAPGREARQGTAPTLASRATAGGGLGTDFDCDGGLIAQPQTFDWQAGGSNDTSFRGKSRSYVTDQPGRARSLTANKTLAVAYGGGNTSGSIEVATAVNAHGGRYDFDSEDGIGRGTPLVAAFHQNQRAEVTTNDTTGALNGGGGKPGQGYPAAHVGSLVRRLTPGECEALQGLPSDWTLIPWRGGMASDGPRYRAIGNAFAVPVVRWIARRIAAEHAADAGLEAAA